MSFAGSSSSSSSRNHAIWTTTALVANSVVIGAPVWVFFVQSPALFSFMGRSKFLPPMMKLTKVLFRWTLPVAASIALGTNLLSVVSTTSTDKQEALAASTQCAAVSLAAILINSLVIVPKALAAGAKATTKKDDNAAAAAASSTTKTDFAVSGGDGSEKSVTKTLHQTVVVFVTVMLVASVGFVHFTIQEQLLTR